MWLQLPACAQKISKECCAELVPIDFRRCELPVHYIDPFTRSAVIFGEPPSIRGPILSGDVVWVWTSLPSHVAPVASSVGRASSKLGDNSSGGDHADGLWAYGLDCLMHAYGLYQAEQDLACAVYRLLIVAVPCFFAKTCSPNASDDFSRSPRSSQKSLSSIIWWMRCRLDPLDKSWRSQKERLPIPVRGSSYTHSSQT